MTVFTAQASSLKTLHKLGSAIFSPRLHDRIKYRLSVLLFSDDSCQTDKGQLCYIAGLLLEYLRARSIYHVMSWSSHKVKRPVRSIGSAEILATGEEIDEGKVLVQPCLLAFLSMSRSM